MDDQKNLITFLVLSTLIFLIWSSMGSRKAAEIREQAEIDKKYEQEQQVETPIEPIELQPRETVINSGQRIEIDTPSLKGNFLVQGSRFDNISLKNYKQTLDDDSESVILLSPQGAEQASYVSDNWVIEEGGTGVNSAWAVISGDKLTPDANVVLKHTGEGFQVERTISVDDKYLITLSDEVTNTSAANVNVVRRALSKQHGMPKGDGDARDLSFILHQGAIAIVDDTQEQLAYGDFEDQREVTNSGTGGWAGLTSKYWLSAAVAPQGKNITTKFKYRNENDTQIFESGYATEPMTITPGKTITSVGHIFAGAKDRKTLRKYETTIEENGQVVFQGISEMERAIDWGRLRWLTRPFNSLISWFFSFLGNYGLAIIALTTLIKLVLFPMFNKQYASQAKMKKVAPKQKRLQEMYKDDRLKLQQEVMALYRKEGVNPMSGCLPIIPTIFIFFALYKTVFINVELRHAPFFGWIQDLSARDPLSAINGFGAFPWDGMLGAGFLSMLAIGPLAIMYGISMAMTFSLSSAQTPDSGNEMMQMQMKIFKWMPWIFMFILAPFAAGLLIYWIWNNVLSIFQQYYITRKYKVETSFDRFFARFSGKGKAKSE